MDIGPHRSCTSYVHDGCFRQRSTKASNGVLGHQAFHCMNEKLFEIDVERDFEAKTQLLTQGHKSLGVVLSEIKMSNNLITPRDRQHAAW